MDMPPQTESEENLMEIFSTQYIETLFYFCLKKTGSTAEAEDLASDITVNILAALKRGTVPASFSAWVWKIARNRYSVWARLKRRRTDEVSGTDIGALEIPGDQSVEEDCIQAEDKRLLRRELAFIAGEYRNLLVAYYVEGRRVQDIADGLGQPEGTVKANLFRSRKRLKEGMNMAREFGIRSYHPEDVEFCASGNQSSGLPWTVVGRKIPKNILLQAHNNPSTLEDLSMELGIAMPYMEEEVKILTDATLLREMGGKYVTNFFIADKECQLAVYQAQQRDSRKRSRLIGGLVEDCLPEIERLSILQGRVNDDGFKWLLFPMLVDRFNEANTTGNIFESFQRPDGGNWGFMGLEKHHLIPESITMEHNCCGNSKITLFGSYGPHDYGMRERAGRMNFAQAALLADLLKNHRALSSLTGSEKRLWEEIDGRFAHGENDQVVPDLAVFEPGAMERMFQILTNHPAYKQAEQAVEALYREVRDILKTNSIPILHEQLDYYVSMLMCDIRMMLIHDEVEAGRLQVPEHPDSSTVGMYLCID